ncbi:MAG: Teichoic acid translocation permease protein TagG [Pelotomaculum sp. PtaB.Bin104]|nr:MAG: Teichoic acid translocation permease protein TagG [Pelotomaculum sp. PtaB.Bin104]
MWHQIKEIYTYREMLKNMVAKELRARYKGSMLGFLWTFLNPLFLLIVYSIAFSYVMRVQVDNFPMFLFVALLPWNFLINSVIQGASSIVQNGALVKKIYFPREVLPLSVVIANLINYLLSLLILIPALLIFKINLTLAIFAFPVVLLAETLFVISLTLLVAIANVYFRDLEHIVGVLMTAWFFLSPIFYPIEFVPQEVRSFFYINPITPIMEAYRDVFFYGEWPQWDILAYLIVAFVILLLISLAAFNHFQKAVAEEI